MKVIIASQKDEKKGEYNPSLTRVVNLKYEDCDVRICRPGQWGNPFRIGRDGTREEVMEKYRKWAPNQPKLMAQLHILKGQRLGCWCKPLPCHGDILCELVETFILQKG